ncbi:Crp/Fnr family transcriptional regulator [Sphingomonas sp. GB1N7]|uniref:Crp/Fnr family transcriptional regulator n=1 Tax=Parasphingomonas caseinilytica TaxID=3096158 RepID=UPI002FC8B706
MPDLPTGDWIETIDPGLRNHLRTVGRHARLRRGEMLFTQGAEPCGLYAVAEGAIGISVSDDKGRQLVLTVLEAGSWFGEIAVMDGQRRTHDARAIRPSTILRIPHDRLLSFLDENPRCWRDIGRLLAQKLRLSFVSTQILALLPAKQRLATRLLLMANGYEGASRPIRNLALSQEVLAAMLSMSRQTVNSVLGELESTGAITLRQGGLVIRDMSLLRTAAEG